MRYDCMPDVELGNLLDRRDRLHVVIVQAMARIDLQPQCGCVPRGLADALKLFIALMLQLRIGIATGVELDRLGTGLDRCFDLVDLRVDEQRDANTCRTQPRTRVLYSRQMCHYIEATLGG